MGKQEYSEKLRDPRWQKKRLEVFERDKWTCQGCDSTDKTLNVHHLWYEGKDPWDAPSDALITLCEECHEGEKELRGAYENDLIDLLKKCRLLNCDLNDITCALRGCSRNEIKQVARMIIDWRIGDGKNA